MGGDWTRREFLVRAAASTTSLMFPGTSENVQAFTGKPIATSQTVDLAPWDLVNVEEN